MENFDRILVGPKATIRETMAQIGAGGAEIALVVDGTRRLLGTVTDGDIRRALLGGATMSDPVEPRMYRQPTTVGPSVGRAEVLDLMRARMLRQIPIVDAEGRVAGLHLLNELIGATSRANWALIIAGGRGTRLQPLTDAVPKPMLPVAGRPILERIVLHLVGFGISRIFIAVHYLSDAIKRHFGDGLRFGCSIEYLIEDTPLGTGGCLSLLPRGAGHPILVMNGDLLTQFDVGHVLAFHERGGFDATIGVRAYGVKIPFGVVDLDGDRVKGLQEKPDVRWTVSAGIYVMEPDIVSTVKSGAAITMPEVLLHCMEAGRRVGAFPIEEDWIDVGVRDELQRARGQGLP